MDQLFIVKFLHSLEGFQGRWNFFLCVDGSHFLIHNSGILHLNLKHVSSFFSVQGCIELLTRSGVSIKGKKAVVVGRSNIVGLPVALLLLKADATVTVVHSHTHDSESIIRGADIIIAAAGQPMMVTILIILGWHKYA